MNTLIEQNYRAFEAGDMDALQGFEWNGVLIWDPTSDETGRLEVDPVEYYGAAYRDSVFAAARAAGLKVGA